MSQGGRLDLGRVNGGARDTVNRIEDLLKVRECSDVEIARAQTRAAKAERDLAEYQDT